MKFYICGKVTGLPHHEALAKFAKSEAHLIAAGVLPENIVNPMTFGIPQSADWHTAMEICIPRLEQCSAILIQRDWCDSFGSKKEITRAQELRFELFFEESNDYNRIAGMVKATNGKQIKASCQSCQGEEWGFCHDLYYGECIHFKTEKL